MSHDGATLFRVTEKTLMVRDVKTERVRARTSLASLGVSLRDEISITVTRDDTVVLVHETGLVHLRPPRWNVPKVETLDGGGIWAACISPLNTLVLSVQGDFPQTSGLVCRSSSSHLVRWVQGMSGQPNSLCALTFRGVACVAARDFIGTEVFRASNGRSMGRLRDYGSEMVYCAGTDELLFWGWRHLYVTALDTGCVRRLRYGKGRGTEACRVAAHGTTVWVSDTTGVYRRVLNLRKCSTVQRRGFGASRFGNLSFSPK